MRGLLPACRLRAEAHRVGVAWNTRPWLAPCHTDGENTDGRRTAIPHSECMTLLCAYSFSTRWPFVDLSPRSVWPCVTELVRVRPTSVRFLPKLARVGGTNLTAGNLPDLARIRRNLARIRRNLKAVDVGPNSTKFGPKSVRFGQPWTRKDPSLPDIGQNWATWGGRTTMILERLRSNVASTRKPCSFDRLVIRRGWSTISKHKIQ